MDVPGAGTFRFHRNCFVLWQAEVDGTHQISGGSAASPWTLFFDVKIARRAASDPSAYRELLAATAEVHLNAGQIQAKARNVRAARPPSPIT